MSIDELQDLIWGYYRDHRRPMAWRDNTEPYWVLVSEVMLQQTQVNRVEPKFAEFIERFPKVQALSEASFADVLDVWTGLGYNRRARFLQRAAQRIVAEHDGQVPNDQSSLEALPGIGPNTASAIRTYAFNQPVIFVETNIRTVFLYHLFPGQTDITDKQLLPLIEQALDHENPREWYWALMDYGTYLKQTNPNPSRASRHHAKQSKFEGSRRQLRAKVLRLLLDGPQEQTDLISTIEDTRLDAVLNDLQHEGLIVLADSNVRLSD